MHVPIAVAGLAMLAAVGVGAVLGYLGTLLFGVMNATRVTRLYLQEKGVLPADVGDSEAPDTEAGA